MTRCFETYRSLWRLLMVVGGMCVASLSYGESVVKVQQYPMGDKVSQSKISHFVQDRNGFIWFGTFDGLMRFDGEHVLNFKTHPGDSVRAENHRIMNVQREEDGNLWLSMYGRHCYTFDTEHYQFHSASDQSFAQYQKQEEQEDLRLKVLMDSLSALYHFKAAALKYVYEDRNHRLWLLGNEDQVYLVENGTCREVPYHGSPVPSTNAAFQVAFEDDYGTVWVQPGDSLPLASYNEKLGRLEQAYTYEEGRRHPLNFYMRMGAIDQQHNFWGNIDEVGFCYLSFHRKEFDFVDSPDSKNDLGSRAMMIDHQGRLWIGWRRNTKDEKGGLALYDKNRQLLGYISPQGTMVQDMAKSVQENVYSLFEDSQHCIWVGTRNHGLYLLEPQNPEGTVFKAQHFENLKNLGEKDETRGTSIYDILEDHEGRIWLASYGEGVWKTLPRPHPFQEARFEQVSTIEKDYRQCRCLCETRDHRIWVGTTKGLVCLDESGQKQPTVYRCTEDLGSLSSSNIMRVMETQDGRLMVSTFGGGINVLRDSPTFEHYDAMRGNYPDVVYSVTEDGKGALWVVSESGLQKYDSQLNLQSTFLEGVPCSEALPVIDKQQRLLYMASKYDVLCLLQGEREVSQFQPPIAFTGLTIHRKEVSAEQPLTPADSVLHFAAEDRNFTLSFVALDYSGQQQIQYEYRIEGQHSQWIPLGNNPVVNVVDLPAGTYRLEVKSTNADGVWCDNGKEMQLVVEPYFYETWWFKGLMWLLLLAALGYGIYLWLHYIDRKRKAGYENQLASAKVRFITEVAKEANPENEAFVQKLVNYIEQQMENEKFSIESAASEMNMSYAAFYRKVKTVMDVTPVELVKQLRMQRAQRLLTEELETPVGEIAYRCGFSSPQYFNRVFKDSWGVTPVEFRTKTRKDGVKSSENV